MSFKVFYKQTCQVQLYHDGIEFIISKPTQDIAKLSALEAYLVQLYSTELRQKRNLEPINCCIQFTFCNDFIDHQVT